MTGNNMDNFTDDASPKAECRPENLRSLRDVIARLEAADEPNDDLNADIARCLGYHVKLSKLYGRWLSCRALGEEDWSFVPNYTGSIDAALTLVPPRHAWGVVRGQDFSDGNWRLREKYGAWVIPANSILADDESSCEDNAVTPAIALCIASLKVTPAMKVGTPAQAESPGDEVQKGKP